MEIVDQLGRFIYLPKPPQRIVSLVPSITETVYDLEMGDHMIGRTKFCIHPSERVSDVLRIGGTKNIRVNDIIKLQPDLILANKEENVRDDVLELANKIPTYISDVKTVADSCALIKDLGSIFNQLLLADDLCKRISTLELKDVSKSQRALYLIWQDPYMSVGNDTFINHMLRVAGYQNVTSSMTRYPVVDLDEIIKDVDVIFLSSEPYPFREKHKESLSEKYGKNVVLVDGEIFSWYGSRLLKAKEYFNQLSKLV